MINTTNDSLISETLGVTVKMRTTSKGHYALPLFDVERVGAHNHTHHDVHITATLDQEGRILRRGDAAQSRQPGSLPGAGTSGQCQSTGSDQPLGWTCARMQWQILLVRQS